MLTFRAKMLYLGISRLKFETSIVTFQINAPKYLILKFSAKIKIFKFGTKIALFWRFGQKL